MLAGAAPCNAPHFEMVTRPPLRQTSSSSNLKINLLPAVLCPLLIFRLPLRFEKDTNKQGLLGCGMVSIKTTIWTVWMEIFWKQERACHKFSCIEAFCTVLVCTAGRKSFVLGCLDIKGTSSSAEMPADGAASFLGTSSFVLMIFFKNWFIWSSLAKLRFAFKGFDMSTFMSAVGEKWRKKHNKLQCNYSSCVQKLYIKWK